MTADPFAALRMRLVDRLRAHGDVRTPAVAAAFARVPRHAFVPSVPAGEAYADRSIAIKLEGGVPISSSSQPAIMAVMLETLNVREGDHVLEIGTGSGYNAALLAELCGGSGRVVSVDLDAELAEAARRRLERAGYGRVRVVCGDGASGDAAGAPYDAIVATVGVDAIPAAWIAQLRTGGRLVAPLTIRSMQKVIAFDRTANGLESSGVFDAAFMMLRGPSASSDAAVIALGEPTLTLRVFAHRAGGVDAHALASAVHAPWREVRAAPTIGIADVWNGVGLWLALGDDGYCTLTAYGPSLEHGIVPQFGREPASAYGYATTTGLCDANALVVFAPFGARDVALRAFGSAAELTERVQRAFASWDAAGRPGNERLSITVAPDGTARTAFAAR